MQGENGEVTSPPEKRVSYEEQCRIIAAEGYIPAMVIIRQMQMRRQSSATLEELRAKPVYNRCLEAFELLSAYGTEYWPIPSDLAEVQGYAGQWSQAVTACEQSWQQTEAALAANPSYTPFYGNPPGRGAARREAHDKVFYPQYFASLVV